MLIFRINNMYCFSWNIKEYKNITYRYWKWRNL